VINGVTSPLHSLTHGSRFVLVSGVGVGPGHPIGCWLFLDSRGVEYRSEQRENSDGKRAESEALA
jgi:hypothetical protein